MVPPESVSRSNRDAGMRVCPPVVCDRLLLLHKRVCRMFVWGVCGVDFRLRNNHIFFTVVSE